MAALKCPGRKVGILFVVLGVILYSVAITFVVIFPSIYQSKLATNLPLTDGSLLYGLWRDVPIPIFQKFYFFNITNAHDFLRGKKMQVEEVGPYVYKCQFTKEDLSWHPNMTLSYRERRTYVFDEERSVGSENDEVYTLNAPLIMAADYIKDYKAIKRGIAGLFFAGIGELPVTRKTIGQLTYAGYEDTIIKMGKYIRSDLPYKKKFAWLYGQNDTDDGLYTVFTGEDDLGKLNIIDNWKGEPELNFWLNDSCNRLDCSNGEVSPPLKENQQQMTFFQSMICRAITFNYTEDVTHLGLDSKRFEITEDVFGNETVNPDNACFNTRPDLPSGVLDMGACKFNAPVVLSSPHFFLADPVYLTKIDGLQPNASKHKSFMDLMPIVGFATEMAIRLQINTFVRRDTAMLNLDKLQTAVYPIFWMEIHGVVTPWLANFVKGKIYGPKIIAYSLVGAIFALGTIFLVVGIVSILNSRRKDLQRKKSEDDPLIDVKNDLKRYSSVTANNGSHEVKENGVTPQAKDTSLVKDVPTSNSINQKEESKDVALIDS